MKIERTKNAARNILFDGILKSLNMVIPFLMRSIMLHYLGVQYLGLNGLFKSILSFLNMAEMGVGSAMVFSMYKPIAEDDTEKICALMRLYRTFYRVIGLFIAVVGLALTPFLRNLISGEIPPDMNLYILYFMNLGSTVLSYWLFAYKHSLLYAYQRRDVGIKVGIVCQIVEYILKISALVIFHNYYLYLAIQLIIQAITNIITAVRVEKLFPGFAPKGHLPKNEVMDIVRRVRDLFSAKFSTVIFNSADTLVISSFMGLTPLAIYQNYFYIITSLRTMLEVIINACVAGVGNSLVTESEEKNYRDLTRFSVLFGWVMAVSSTILLCVYQPFMQLWMGEENLLAFNYVVCFVIYYYTMGMNKIMNMFKDAAGIWRKDRWRPMIAALVNLGLNLATVKWLGLYGVLLSSVVSIVFVQIPWLFHNLFDEVFPAKYKWHYIRFFAGLVVTAVAGCAAALLVCNLFHLTAWTAFFVNACISFIVPNIVFFALYGRNPLFKDSIRQIFNTVLKKLPKGKK